MLDRVDGLVKVHYIDVAAFEEYKHHILCLMDGLVKLPCMAERHAIFTAKKEDFETLTNIWERMLLGWCKEIQNERFDFGHNKESRFYGAQDARKI